MPPKRDETKRGGLAARLHAAIEDSGRSLYDIADRAGVNRSVVARFVAGERSMSLGSADAIAGALGLKLVEAERRGARRKGKGKE